MRPDQRGNKQPRRSPRHGDGEFRFALPPERAAGMTAIITTRAGRWILGATLSARSCGSLCAGADPLSRTQRPRSGIGAALPLVGGGVPDPVRRDRRRRGHRERVPERARDRERLAARDALGRDRRRGRVRGACDAPRRAADRPLRRTRPDRGRGGVPRRGLRRALGDERALALRRRERAARARLRRRRDAPHHDRGDGARPGPHGPRARSRFGRRQSRRARCSPRRCRR